MLKPHRVADQPVSNSGRAHRDVRRVDGPGISDLVTYGFEPVRSRWTWQPRLAELWLKWSRHDTDNSRDAGVRRRT